MKELIVRLSFPFEGGLEGLSLRASTSSLLPLEGSLVDPRLRASNEHIPIVRVLRARRTPGRAFPSLQGRSLSLRDRD